MSDTSRPIVCFFSVFLIARGGNGPEDRTREIEVKLIFRSLLLLLNAAYARKLIQSELRCFWRRGDISSATDQYLDNINTAARQICSSIWYLSVRRRI